MINIGNNEIVKIYIGSSEIAKVYSGMDEIYPVATDLVITKHNITTTSSATRLLYSTTNIAKVYIDGTEQPSVSTGYTFSTTGTHTVKFKLTDNTKINASQFRGCNTITAATLPDTITSIATYAFYGTSLSEVNIPSGVSKINDFTFENCPLTSITIPDGVTDIGQYAFYGCTALTSVNIPDSVTIVGKQAFQNCSGLTSITVGSGVTAFSGSCFENCSSLTEMTITATAPPVLWPNAINNTNDCPIYVPTASVATYQAATNWSNYAARINPIT